MCYKLSILKCYIKILTHIPDKTFFNHKSFTEIVCHILMYFYSTTIYCICFILSIKILETIFDKPRDNSN